MGQKGHPFKERKREKTIPHATEHTYIAHTREYPLPPGLQRSSIWVQLFTWPHAKRQASQLESALYRCLIYQQSQYIKNVIGLS